MPLAIHKFVTGPLETNTYVISNGARGLVVDPSSGCDDVLRLVARQKLSIVALLLTHCHFDHIMGISEIQATAASVPVWAHPAERPLLTNAEYNGSYLIGRPSVYDGPVSALSEGQCTISDFSFEVVHLPGHSPGGCAFVFREAGADADAQAVHCFSGDALFAGSIGRSDFPLGDGPLLIKSITEKLLLLPDATIVYPGHGGRTTIGREKRMNPFLIDSTRM
jgi:glyoxylase-like metal-dependent hydrolase (beta-lactamase superfamily II)